VPLDPADVVQISRDPRGGLRGTSALKSYAPHMAAAITSAELGKQFMAGGVPNAILKSDRKLEAQQALLLQTQWEVATQMRRGKPAVLPPEISFEQLAFSPKDLMLLEGQEFESRVIASAFGVPPHMINMPLAGGLTYQSPEMLVEEWWRTELRPAGMRISQALSAQMLPRGSWVEFDARDVLAPSFADLVTSWSKLLADGIVTVDEARAAVVRLPPLEQGEALDALTEPSVASSTNVQPLRPAQITGMEVTAQ
jgi:HK97 family phage portal protein